MFFCKKLWDAITFEEYTQIYSMDVPEDDLGKNISQILVP
jgi:hypothetical protein